MTHTYLLATKLDDTNPQHVADLAKMQASPDRFLLEIPMGGVGAFIKRDANGNLVCKEWTMDVSTDTVDAGALNLVELKNKINEVVLVVNHLKQTIR